MKKAIKILGSIICLFLLVYGVMFVKIGDKTVFRYTEEFRIGEECNEKEQKKIGNLKRLSKLDISSKYVSSLDFVYDLSSLKKLNIGYAPNMDMSSLSECSRLEILYITGTTLDSFEHISTLTMLKDIDLWLCDTYDISGIKNLKKLESFGLNNGKSGGSVTGIEELSELTNLTSVSLDHAKRLDIAAIAECKNLTSLSLINSDESIDAAELIKLEKLEKLYIPDSSLENAEKLLDLKELRDITFSGDMVDEALINSLKENNVSVQLL